MATENESSYDVVAVRCFACESRGKAERKWAQDENSESAGIMFAVVEADEETA